MEKLLVLIQKKRAPSAWPESTRLKSNSLNSHTPALGSEHMFFPECPTAEPSPESLRCYVLSIGVYMILKINTFIFSLVLLLEINLKNVVFFP